jgi:hypothetical protein
VSGAFNIVVISGAGGTPDSTYFAVRDQGSAATIDNISVKELPGNHAVQATTANRPIYGIHPFGGRRNLLVRTEEFENASWTKQNVTVTQNVSGPLGTNQMWTLTDNATNGEHRLYISSPNTSGVYSLYAKAGTLSFIGLSQSGTGYSVFNLTNGTVAQNEGDRVGAITSVGDGWYRISMQTVTTNTFFVIKMGETAAQVLGSTAYAGTGKTVLISGAQLETGSTATAYQRVTDQYNVTEAGVSSVSYLFFDGVNDSLATSTITPGVDKAQVFAGVRKLSDAATGAFFELSTDAGGTNGSLGNFSGFPSGGYTFRSRGTTTVDAQTSSFAAPTTDVFTGLSDISGDRATLRIDGVQVAQITTDQGTGNFLAYPLYIGARAGTSLFFSGHLYGLIARFGPNLDTGRISSTETWVAGKTGVVI